MLHAVLDAGCFWNDARTRAADTSRLDKAILMVSALQSAWAVWPPDAIRALTETCWTVRGYGASYDVAMLARARPTFGSAATAWNGIMLPRTS